MSGALHGPPLTVSSSLARRIGGPTGQPSGAGGIPANPGRLDRPARRCVYPGPAAVCGTAQTRLRYRQHGPAAVCGTAQTRLRYRQHGPAAVCGTAQTRLRYRQHGPAAVCGTAQTRLRYRQHGPAAVCGTAQTRLRYRQHGPAAVCGTAQTRLRYRQHGTGCSVRYSSDQTAIPAARNRLQCAVQLRPDCDTGSTARLQCAVQLRPDCDTGSTEQAAVCGTAQTRLRYRQHGPAAVCGTAQTRLRYRQHGTGCSVRYSSDQTAIPAARNRLQCAVQLRPDCDTGSTEQITRPAVNIDQYILHTVRIFSSPGH